jgi:hypothetical protein
MTTKKVLRTIVGNFGIPNQVVPAVEHFPAEVDSIVITTSIVTNIFGCPIKTGSQNRKRKLQETECQNIIILGKLRK